MLEIRHTTRVPLLPCDAVGQNRGMNQLLSADETAARLPYVALAMQIGEVLADPSVQVPERLVQPLPGGRCLSSARARRAARGLGLQAKVVDDPNAALVDCPLVTCTPANAVVLHATPRADAFIAAVGAFTPRMVELGPDLCRHFAAHGKIVVDTPQAIHEAGDLLQAGLDVAAFATLRDVLGSAVAVGGPVLFKSCGWAGWDLAAARTAMSDQSAG